MKNKILRERKGILTTEWAKLEIVLLEYIGCDIKENFPYLLESQEANCIVIFISQFSSVTQSCPTLCDPIMNCSTPGFPVHHQLPEFTQTHVHRVGDAIQPSHLLSSPSPPVPNPSQHQSFPMSKLFASGGQSIGVSIYS